MRSAGTREPANARAQLLLASCLLELGHKLEAIERVRTLIAAAPQLFGQGAQSPGRARTRPPVAQAKRGGRIPAAETESLT
jgi:Tetratricopeptide repeat